ncbi:MAG: SCO family protein [Alphaproteobacteria bacterium]|nr:SCO family protein [Alphaproteobacteria bacterium]
MAPVPRSVVWGLIGAALFAVGTFAFVVVHKLTNAPVASVRTVATLGEAQIGGPFTLIDGEGVERSEGEFRGRHLLVYFGFTFCPDVCPTELQVMSAALDRLGPLAESVQPLFITIDPERDTPAAMKDYVGNFHPRLIGLTGSAQAVAKAAKAYRVYYRRNDARDASQYLMDHSSIVYLMGPDGRYLAHFGPNTKPETMAATIRKHIAGG